jgi:uncharacterized protein (DUF2141 family)
MKKALILAATLAATLAIPFAAEACERTIEITNVRSGAGPVMVAVYAAEVSFMKTPALAVRVFASEATLRVPVCGIEAREIAVMAYQDLNINQRLDTNPIGIPTEPFGASGEGVGFGAPSWARVRVALAAAGPAAVQVALSK